MEDSETILVGTSIQSDSCLSLAMYPTIRRCHCRSLLPGICARKRKGILATDTTGWLLIYTPSVPYRTIHSVALSPYPTRYLALGHRLTDGGHQNLHKRRKWPWSASSMAGVVHQNAAEFWTTYAASMYLWQQDSISDYKCHISKWLQAKGLNDISNVIGI